MADPLLGMSSIQLEVTDWIESKGCKIEGKGKDLTSELLEFIGELAVDRKKQRNRAKVPVYQRCQAYKANGEQCTRRRKADHDLCGTHGKGTPHGRFTSSKGAIPKTTRYLTSVREVKGINYHVDTKTDEVYRTEDILKGDRLPRVIGTLIHNDNEMKIVYAK